MLNQKIALLSLLFVLLLGAASNAPIAEASNGILEINQSCAAVGCFDGDLAGWPVTIGSRGSYRLTSNLDLFGPGGGIEIIADGTTIDLAGFGIRLCIDPPPGVFCNFSGQDDGIGSGSALDVTVRNGVVQGFRGWGVDLGARGAARDLVVRANVLGGIRVGTNSLVQDNRIGFNQGPGASLAFGTGWGGNVLVTNSPDFTGAPFALTRNVCSAGHCTWDGPRRFYRTTTSVSVGDIDTACADGFRPAHGAELHNPASLYYDEALAGGGFQSNAGGWVEGTCTAASWADMDPADTIRDGWTVGETICGSTFPVWCIEE